MKLESKYLKHFQCIDLSADFYYTQGELNLTQVWPKCFQTDEIESKYCWNSHLIQRIPRMWRLVIIHGFAGSRSGSTNLVQKLHRFSRVRIFYCLIIITQAIR